MICSYQAFFCLQELLTRHKILCAEFLELNYEKVFHHYQKLLNSENYVTRRQALKVHIPCIFIVLTFCFEENASQCISFKLQTTSCKSFFFSKKVLLYLLMCCCKHVFLLKYSTVPQSYMQWFTCIWKCASAYFVYIVKCILVFNINYM